MVMVKIRFFACVQKGRERRGEGSPLWSAAAGGEREKELKGKREREINKKTLQERRLGAEGEDSGSNKEAGSTPRRHPDAPARRRETRPDARADAVRGGRGRRAVMSSARTPAQQQDGADRGAPGPAGQQRRSEESAPAAGTSRGGDRGARRRTGREAAADTAREQPPEPDNPGGVVGVERSGSDQESSSNSPECRVRFVNTTQRPVKLVWLDDRGRRVVRGTLAAQTAHSVLTRRTHPWIFLDAETGERLAAKRGDGGSRSGFFESGSHLRALREAGECSEERARQLAGGHGLICVFILPSVDGLRTLAIRTVRSRLNRKEDCFCLDVPQKVQFELAQMFV